MLARQSYRLCQRFATFCLVVSLLATVGSGADEPHLYVFSMPGCRPCQQMEPDVDRLAQAGYPVTKIDCVANEAWANHFQITQAPTTVLVSGQQVVSRSLGPQNYADLIKLFDAVGFRPRQSETKSSLVANVTAPIQPTAAEREPSAPTAASAWTQPQLAAHRSAIRLKVEDPQGTSYAAGTVIHRHGDECLAITCGHVFRDSQGTGKITVDYGFNEGQHLTSPGQLIKYDSDARDVGLVVFKTQRSIEPVRIAPQALPVQPGDQVFSLGCDHGADPTLRLTQIIRTAVYDGATKYDIVGRPVDGRSGGGLFSAGGQLIGICNAAAVEEDEGVYTSLENIYWQISQANMAHLFQPTAAIAQVGVNATQQFQGQLDVRPRQPISSTTVQGEVEIIMVVRSKSNPEIAETISISQPSSQLLGMVESLRASDTNSRRTAANRETFPVPPLANQTTPNLRGQSYR